MILDVLATIFEELILSISVSYMLKIRYSLLYVLITTIICVFETVVFCDFYVNNFILIFLIIFTHSCILFLFKKNNIIQNILTITLFMLLLLVSNYLSLYIYSILEQIPVVEISNHLSIFSNSIIFSKFLFALISFLVVFYLKKKHETLLLEKNKITSLIILDIVFIFTLLGEALVFNKISNTTILVIMLQLIILSVLFFVLYIILITENKEKIKLIKKTTKLEYLRINTDKISQMYNVIIAKEHSMIYFLRKISLSIDDKNLRNLINKEIDRITSYKFISNTGNYKFDHDISSKINQLKDSGYDIKVIMMIEENPKLNQQNVISELLEFIENICIYSKNNKIELRLKNIDNILIIRAISVFFDSKIEQLGEKIINGGKFESVYKKIHLNDD